MSKERFKIQIIDREDPKSNMNIYFLTDDIFVNSHYYSPPGRPQDMELHPEITLKFLGMSIKSKGKAKKRGKQRKT
jgi:hypothetical protein